jgi:hypothetical protein
VFMSQHSNLATVWEHLLGRYDLPEVLREIIGQHALRCTFLDHEAQPNNEAFEAIIWIKTIFDLQRCYITGHPTGVSEISSHLSAYLLQPDLLLLSILYLISAKSHIISSENSVTASEVLQRLILAQTVLSGVRLLLWYKERISTHEKWRLQTAITEAWKDDHMQEIECCIVQQVIPAMLNMMKESDHVDAYRMERNNAGLPTYASGLVSIAQ